MDFNIKDDRFTDADVGWYMLTTWHTMLEKYLVYSPPEYFLHSFFSTNLKKSLQMLQKSLCENLKILIAPLNIKLSSVKPTGTVSSVVLGFNNLCFITKISGHIL